MFSTVKLEYVSKNVLFVQFDKITVSEHDLPAIFKGQSDHFKKRIKII